MTDVHPEEIEAAGRRIAVNGDEWLAELQRLRNLSPESAYGDDEVGRIMSEFHNATHARSLEYFQEVGECVGDVGEGLIRVAELYADTERDNISRALAVAREIENIGAI